ncbi:hypothetical protein NIES22_51030 [Calothrix brevissima NIES-22]|nr:hypothetical protein NIES22_51030 [Calothrix brevissima NIES-22]
MDTIYIAPEYVEYFKDKKGELHPLCFYLYSDGYIEGKYVNSLDLLEAIGYVYVWDSWQAIRKAKELELGTIECSLTTKYYDEERDGYYIFDEDFITLDQAKVVVESTSKIGKGEKQRLLTFIKNSM